MAKEEKKEEKKIIIDEDWKQEASGGHCRREILRLW
jgi:hypothetical protein